MPDPLGIEAPASANVGEAVTVTVTRYNAKGEPSPAVGATVTGAAQRASTQSGGHATVSFSGAGRYTLTASATETYAPRPTICVHTGNDGTCGTSAPAAPPAHPGGAPAQSAAGPFAFVARPRRSDRRAPLPAQPCSAAAVGLGQRAGSRDLDLRLTAAARPTAVAAGPTDGARARLRRVRCREGSVLQDRIRRRRLLLPAARPLRAGSLRARRAGHRRAGRPRRRSPGALEDRLLCRAERAIPAMGKPPSIRPRGRLRRAPSPAVVRRCQSCIALAGLRPRRRAGAERRAARRSRANSARSAVRSWSAPRVRGQETVMSLLMRNASRDDALRRRLRGEHRRHLRRAAKAAQPVDWFYYVNGVEAPKGAAATNVHPGDHIWWDRHDWSQTDSVPAVVGSFPEPFLNGLEGKRLPVRVECAQPSAPRLPHRHRAAARARRARGDRRDRQRRRAGNAARDRRAVDARSSANPATRGDRGRAGRERRVRALRARRRDAHAARRRRRSGAHARRRRGADRRHAPGRSRARVGRHRDRRAGVDLAARAFDAG